MNERAAVPAELPARGRVALVLAGGAARGAYEVGVAQHIVDEVARDLGRPVPLDVLCGTSVGALNACALAAFADDPSAGARRLVEVWTNLGPESVLRFDRGEMFSFLRSLVGRPAPLPLDADHGVGLVDPRLVEQLIRDACPFERIEEHVQSGRLHAVTLTATHVASGRTVIFVARRAPLPHDWTHDPTARAERVVLEPIHALASAAIPLLFPAIRIEGEFYCDGGLRQNVPLSPARRLGADGIVVVSPRYLPLPAANEAQVATTTPFFPGPLTLLGKTLNALLLDRLDSDIDRLTRINRILEAGTRRWGSGFLDDLNLELGYPPGEGLRPLSAVLVRASRDIGEIGVEYVREPAFAKRVRGMLGRILRSIADAEGVAQADLLSYLLFDGEYARRLIELGRADARRQHEELCGFFTRLMDPGWSRPALG